jgi:hypothetical protein
MRFSIRINNDLPVAETVRLAQAAEAAGFDQFWVSNDLFLRSAPTLLAALATHTERIELGSCIFNPYTIHPAELAMLAATMDELIFWAGWGWRMTGRFNPCAKPSWRYADSCVASVSASTATFCNGRTKPISVFRRRG